MNDNSQQTPPPLPDGAPAPVKPPGPERIGRTRRGYASSAVFRRQLTEGMPRTWVTWSLLAANCLVFAAMVATGSSVMTPTVEDLLAWGGDFGPLAMQGESWRLVSSAFVHIGLLHLAMNMICLAKTGPLLERLIGHSNMAAIYVFSMVIGSLVSICFLGDSVGAGASGAIFGLFGALFRCMGVLQRKVPKEIFSDLRIWVGLFVAYNVLTGLSDPSIDNAAHVGGVVAGYLGAVLLCRARESEDAQVPLMQTNYRMTAVMIPIVALAYFTVDSITATRPLHQAYPLMAAMERAEAKEDYQAALTYSDKLVELLPDEAYLHGQRGLHLGNIARFDDALAATKRAVHLNHSEPMWHNNLAWILSSLKRYEQGAEAAREAISLAPDMLLAHQNLLDCLMELGDNPPYLEAAQAAVSRIESAAWLHGHLSWGLYNADKLDQAIESATRCLELAPDYTWAQDHLKSMLAERAAGK